MEASIDGTQWDAANATATKFTIAGLSTVNIAGATAAADAMTISFGGLVSTGTYTLAGGAPLLSLSYTPGAQLGLQAFIAQSGTVTITTIDDDKIKGTFSFEGKRFQDNATTSVTSGSFDVEFTQLGI